MEASPPATCVLDQADLDRVLARLAHEIVDQYNVDQAGPLDVRPHSLAVIGVRTGGAHLASRLATQLGALLGETPPLGILDITLYRDDVMFAGSNAVLRGTEIDFAIDGRYVVVVDDVLYTGRTVRAALDALLDLGRPRCVRLAVLIDRGLRELPVGADFVGRDLPTSSNERVVVQLQEEGFDRDQVLLTVRHDRRGSSR